MIKELPELVFNKRYDNFFLLTEFDVIFNEDFYKELISFIKELGANKLFFSLEDLTDNISSATKRIEFINVSVEELKKFYEMHVEFNEKTIPIHYINHFIYDDSHQWEIYVSRENELSIFGCDDKIKTLFFDIFKPYQEETLHIKYKIR